VLLIEAGGNDKMSRVIVPNQWHLNLGTERDWCFVAQSNPHLHRRFIPLSMGKVLGGGSSINALGWARGHKKDWDFFAAEAGDPAWCDEAVLKICRRIEDWHGAPDPDVEGRKDRFLPSPRPTPVQWRLPCWSERVQLGFRLSIAITVR
jgi:choline dehydrogenase